MTALAMLLAATALSATSIALPPDGSHARAVDCGDGYWLIDVSPDEDVRGEIAVSGDGDAETRGCSGVFGAGLSRDGDVRCHDSGVTYLCASGAGNAECGAAICAAAEDARCTGSGGIFTSPAVCLSLGGDAESSHAGSDPAVVVAALGSASCEGQTCAAVGPGEQTIRILGLTIVR
jgi:hypothetical protein